MRIIILSLLFMLSLHAIAYSQKADYGSSTTVYDISSKESKDYKLRVTLPKNYDEDRRYPVLYYMDAWWLSEMVLGSYAVLSETQQVVDVVFVGITLDGNGLDWNIQRTFDFTPSKYDLPVSFTAGIGDDAIKLDEKITGGADIFIDFMESDIFHFVDSKFPNLEENRGFIGHSFGGLFGFHLLQKKPDLFNGYIIISPSLWWNKTEMLDQALFDNFKKEMGPSKLHLSYGTKESKWITSSNIKMDSIINDLGKDQLDYKFVAYDKADHHSILSRAIYDGLLYIYSK